MLKKKGLNERIITKPVKRISELVSHKGKPFITDNTAALFGKKRKKDNSNL